MRRIVMFVSLLLVIALAALPALAQSGSNMVSYNGFSFTYPSSVATNVNIYQFPGDAVDAAYPGGPQPPYTQFTLYSSQFAPESTWEGALSIYVFDTASFANYSFFQQEFTTLNTLLQGRSDLAAMMSVDSPDDIGSKTLPFLPIFPAAQEIRARAQYVDLGQFSGIAYVTSFGQDASPIVANELRYTFQGISADGTKYVALIANLNTGLIPNEIPADFDYDAFVANIAGEFNNTINIVNAGATTDFTPSLDDLASIVSSFSWGGVSVQPVPDLPAAPTPGAEPTTVVNTDPTLGGLAGDWTLVSFGATGTEQLPVENAPITISFSQQGVGGTDGCNSYGGSFAYDNNTLTFSPLVSTLMACAEPIMPVASAYLTALQAATGYSIDGETLTISYPEGSLIYTAAVG